MGRGNSRFGTPVEARNEEVERNCYQAIHRHVYAAPNDPQDEDDYDNFHTDLEEVIASHLEDQYPKVFAQADRGVKGSSDLSVIWETADIGIALADNQTSTAVYVYGKDESDMDDAKLEERVHDIASRLFYALRFFDLSQRACSWTSTRYKGIPRPT